MRKKLSRTTTLMHESHESLFILGSNTPSSIHICLDWVMLSRRSWNDICFSSLVPLCGCHHENSRHCRITKWIWRRCVYELYVPTKGNYVACPHTHTHIYMESRQFYKLVCANFVLTALIVAVTISSQFLRETCPTCFRENIAQSRIACGFCGWPKLCWQIRIDAYDTDSFQIYGLSASNNCWSRPEGLYCVAERETRAILISSFFAVCLPQTRQHMSGLVDKWQVRWSGYRNCIGIFINIITTIYLKYLSISVYSHNINKYIHNLNANMSIPI